MNEHENPPSGTRPDVRPAETTVHPARVHDYWLTGTEITPIDKESAKWALRIVPELRDYAIGNQQFIARSVRFLADAGIRQFLDIGAGFLASPSVHEVAQAVDPDSLVVYACDDELAFKQANEVLSPNAAAMAVKADPRDVMSVLESAALLLDFDQPMAIMFMSCLHNMLDADDPAGVVKRYVEAVVPGSYLAMSHSTHDMAPARMRLGSELARRMAGLTFVPRHRRRILKMFNGHDLIEPGLVQVSYWRPDGVPEPNADRVWAYGGIARL